MRLKRLHVACIAISVSLALVIVLTIILAVRIASRLDFNRVVYNHRPGKCHRVKGPVHGAEDIELLSDDGIAFVSSFGSPDKGVKGQIFLYDFGQSDNRRAIPLGIVGRDFNVSHFSPHGLSSHVDPHSGHITLYAISHNPQDSSDHSVEVFHYQPDSLTLQHIRSIRDSKKFYHPNDLAAVGKDKFVLSNDFSGWAVFETLVGWDSGSLVYFDGKNSHRVADDLGAANGVFFNAKKRLLYVTTFTGEHLIVYRPSKDFRSLELIAQIPLNSGGDNIFVDRDDGIWIGAHPVLKDAVGHFWDRNDPDAKAPSQVLRVKFTEGFDDYKISEVYSDDGSQLSAATVAVYYREQVLIGSAYRGLLLCDVHDHHVVTS